MPNRILLVDDDRGFRQAFATALTDSGYHVIEAGGGREGLEKVTAEKPDLVLCDLRMPDGDGLQVLAQLARERPLLPVVVMSGAGLLTDAIAALRLGAWDYIVKPPPEQAVVEHALKKALERASLLRENELYRTYLERVNAELRMSLAVIEEDEAAGRKIQFGLLPERNTRFGDLSFDCELTTSTMLSGDFVDCFRIDATHIGFYLADVAGHGVSSALVTVLLKSFMGRQLRRLNEGSSDVIRSPARAMDQLNRELLLERVQKHLTMFYGIIDTENGCLTYCSAGQFPAPMLFDGRDARFLESRGFPVGMFERAEYKEHALALPTDFVLAVCSDGVLDLLRGETFEAKHERLLAMVNTLQLTVADLHRSLALGPRERPADDVTLLVVAKGSEDHELS